MKARYLIALLLAGVTSQAVAQDARLAVEPAEPAPGGIVRVTLRVGGADDSIVAIRGTLAGEPLRFIGGDSTFRAIGGVPVDATDSVMTRVYVQRRSGTTDTLLLAVSVPPPPPPPKETKLAVDQRFTRPLDKATQARIARENALALQVGRDAHRQPPLWTEEFQRPRESVVTSRFGTGRMFNGTVASRHLGVDYRGAPGEPVYAANRGVVALVDTFFLAGRVVYIDHGGGVVTGYFHLTSPLVAKGDTVERGEKIGTVGATGRVTGPHLHWSARYGAITVNPGDLLELPPGFYGKRE